MKIIREIIENMNNTLEEAEHYYNEYIIYKDDYSEMASTALQMAKTHLELYNKWHDVVVNMINKYRSSGKEIPSTMQELYDYEHKNLTKEYSELKYKVNN